MKACRFRCWFTCEPGGAESGPFGETLKRSKVDQTFQKRTILEYLKAIQSTSSKIPPGHLFLQDSEAWLNSLKACATTWWQSQRPLVRKDAKSVVGSRCKECKAELVPSALMRWWSWCFWMFQVFLGLSGAFGKPTFFFGRICTSTWSTSIAQSLPCPLRSYSFFSGNCHWYFCWCFIVNGNWNLLFLGCFWFEWYFRLQEVYWLSLTVFLLLRLQDSLSKRSNETDKS